MNWFKVEVRHGEKGTYHWVGSANATLESLAQRVRDAEPIRLDQLLYYDRGKVKEWEDWDRSLVGSIVIPAREVVSIMQFRGDPRRLPLGS